MVATKRSASTQSAPRKKAKKEPESESESDIASSGSSEQSEAQADADGKRPNTTGTMKSAAKEGAKSTDLPEEMSGTPLAKLYKAMDDLAKAKKAPSKGKDHVVVYWMRNKDLRLDDNRALAHACAVAKEKSLPLLALHIFSPSDYKAHDRSPRRIDFMLRQLAYLQEELAKKDVPLLTVTWDDRTEIVGKLLKCLEDDWKAAALYGNIEYEVDELRRDEQILRKVIDSRGNGKGWAGEIAFLKDFVIVPPGEILTKQGKPYSVFSPWFKNWADTVASDMLSYVGDAGGLEANPKSARQHDVLKPFFSHKLTTSIEGFSLSETEAKYMQQIWPVGEETTRQVMHRFLKTKIRKQKFFEPPLADGAEEADDPLKKSKIGEYATGRNRVDLDGTSHISPYLAAGLISPRETLRMTMKLTKNQLYTGRDQGGVGVWVSEVAWRDFYQHVLAAWPRICMNRAFNPKFEDVVWEHSEEHLKAWKEGKTGYPIVDAAMRSLNAQGYMHASYINRCRMIVAMFLTKDLLLDWRLGEKYFMQQLIDGDLGSNNGGWQWSSSTGTDPQPYFRVFNPTAQSEKADPDGDYIRHWVPELSKIRGKAIHEPSAMMSKKEIEKLGYVMPIVDHAKARKRAIARFKNPGMSDDE
ncbi:BQ2448_7807 [Microbotryum intermedium]|uniref:BQ2448_7807 protein n=1 Tax=Microbotryum intermedium TaxID=269621 RepID=A0A238FU76_9BASI|nr:BQ2448_7807 [Microbotryum intermedium]